MEPEFFCVITCDTTMSHLFTQGRNYDVFIIDGDYYITDASHTQCEVFKSCYNDNVWLTIDGVTARFDEARR